MYAIHVQATTRLFKNCVQGNRAVMHLNGNCMNYCHAPAGANMFGSRLSEQITLRAARGLLKNGLTDPQTIKVSSSAPEDATAEVTSFRTGQGAGPVISFKRAEPAQVIMVTSRGLMTASYVQDTPLKDEIIAMNSEGNVQRGEIHMCWLTLRYLLEPGGQAVQLQQPTTMQAGSLQQATGGEHSGCPGLLQAPACLIT